MIVQTSDQIFQELLVYKETLSPLAELTTDIVDEEDLANAIEMSTLDDSQVAEWVTILEIMAYHSKIVQDGMQSAITEIKNTILRDRIPDLNWVIQKILLYQDTDPVILIDGIPGYAVVDTNKQILGSVTIRPKLNNLEVKVRTKSGVLLTPEQRVSLTYYIFRVVGAGTRLTLINYDPDRITLNMEIIYDGTKDLTTLKTSVAAAINTYLSNVEFDASILVNKLVDGIQKVDGVIDPRVTTISAIDILNNVTTFPYEYPTFAGYAIINTATPLDATIIYTPR